MATKVSMNLLNPSTSRIQMQMPKSRATHQMLLAKTSPFLTMSNNASRTRAQKLEISNNSRSSLIMRKSRGCKSCGGG
tara:strand:+ start:603 stop:836 length:234 start_codon:yes stop_codon:yes gene_type:complete